MTLYLDTSLLIAAYTFEAATTRALAFLNNPGESLVISEWVATEFSAALSMKIRAGDIDDAYRVEALDLFEKSMANSLEVVPVATPHFRTAARFGTKHRLRLRAGDALHLAVAEERRATLCTLDKRLSAAGEALGVATRLI